MPFGKTTPLWKRKLTGKSVGRTGTAAACCEFGANDRGEPLWTVGIQNDNPLESSSKAENLLEASKRQRLTLNLLLGELDGLDDSNRPTVRFETRRTGY